MSTVQQAEGSAPPLPFIGVGFGPANLAFAVALQETALAVLRDGFFFEGKPEFAWHPEMLLPSSRVQISFLKDLVLQRNPTSPFTYINFLHQQGWLNDFINLNSKVPSRAEYNTYFRWAAGFFAENVKYAHQVESLDPVLSSDGVVRTVKVSVRNLQSDSIGSYETASLVVAMGAQPRLPISATQFDRRRMAHSSTFLSSLRTMKTLNPTPQRLVVLGSGQSAAEILLYLLQEFPNTEVVSVQRRYSFKQSDNNPFLNEVFSPLERSRFYHGNSRYRSLVMRDVAVANYSVVERSLLDQLYFEKYRRMQNAAPPPIVYQFTEILEAHSNKEYVQLLLRDLVTGETNSVKADFVFFGSGYDWTCPKLLVDALGEYVQRDESGEVMYSDSSRLLTQAHFRVPVYVQGAAEHSYGIGETLLSNLADRAGKLAGDLKTQLPHHIAR